MCMCVCERERERERERKREIVWVGERERVLCVKGRECCVCLEPFYQHFDCRTDG